jgi:hypothetical protein
MLGYTSAINCDFEIWTEMHVVNYILELNTLA